MKRILGVHPDCGAPQSTDGLGGVAAFFAKGCACVLFVLAGPGAAALDRLWWERDEAGNG